MKRNGNSAESGNLIRIIELEKRVEMQAEASRSAIALAANDLRTRLDNMNEFRNSLRDQASTFVPRNELDHTFENIHNSFKTAKEIFDNKNDIMQKQIDELRLARAELQGKANMSSVFVAYAIAGIGIIISIIRIWGGVLSK